MKKLKEKTCKAPKKKSDGKGKCGTKFLTKNKDRKYCSTQCERRAGYHNRRNQEIKKENEIKSYGCSDEIDLKNSKHLIDHIRESKENILKLHKSTINKYPRISNPNLDYSSNIPKELTDSIYSLIHHTGKKGKSQSIAKAYDKAIQEIRDEPVLGEVLIAVEYRRVSIDIKKSVYQIFEQQDQNSIFKKKPTQPEKTNSEEILKSINEKILKGINTIDLGRHKHGIKK